METETKNPHSNLVENSSYSHILQTNNSSSHFSLEKKIRKEMKENICFLDVVLF